MTISRALIDRYTGVIRETYNASILVIEGTGQCLGFRIFEVDNASSNSTFVQFLAYYCDNNGLNF
ncbi:hypothetical protein OUZ56_026452 [Daphnia magna]|uniref:Uncharacterized protein n=1 Tax=Daphnia magna TaxID=35525 RepID=A0ABQ9ZMT0_9CRUS|nr:hypothetical protein OUZ56_026452 [Daphnia magna]